MIPASHASRSPVDAVDAPDRKHVRRIAARDEDHVLRKQVFAHVSPRHAEELEMGGLAANGRECLVEEDDPVGRISGRRREEADARPLVPGETEYLATDRATGLEVAAEGDDVRAHRLSDSAYARRGIAAGRSSGAVTGA